MFGLSILTTRAKNIRAGGTKTRTVVEVHGNTEGTISGANKVIVGPTGCCKSSICAERLDIAGEVFGDVDVQELVIRKSGRIHGRARYKKLALLEGAVLYLDNDLSESETAIAELPAAAGADSIPFDGPVRQAPAKRQAAPKPVFERAPEPPAKAGTDPAAADPDFSDGEDAQEPKFTTSY